MFRTTLAFLIPHLPLPGILRLRTLRHNSLLLEVHLKGEDVSVRLLHVCRVTLPLTVVHLRAHECVHLAT